jgi:hypothetical protein
VLTLVSARYQRGGARQWPSIASLSATNHIGDVSRETLPKWQYFALLGPEPARDKLPQGPNEARMTPQ